MNIIFSLKSWEEYIEYQNGDKCLNKMNGFIREIIRHGPLYGTGQPEKLRYNLSGLYSRRINKEHRLVYGMGTNGDLMIYKCKGHYSG